MNERDVQAAVRLEYARRGYRLWRNNSGVMIAANGQAVRYGLANDSKALNEQIKSSDLIGWRPVTVTLGHVGLTLALFTSLECKASDWTLRPGDRRGQAQKRWLDLVAGDGGEARFITGIEV